MQLLSLDRAVSSALLLQMDPDFCSNGHLSPRKPCLDGEVLIEQTTSNLSLLSKYLLVRIALLPAALSGVIKGNATSRTIGREEKLLRHEKVSSIKQFPHLPP